MTQSDLEVILKLKYGYQADAAQQVASDLLGMSAEWQQRFQDYLESGILPAEPEVDQINVARLVSGQRLLPPAAFLTMAWIDEEPELALKAVKAGYDLINL